MIAREREKKEKRQDRATDGKQHIRSLGQTQFLLVVHVPIKPQVTVSNEIKVNSRA